MKDAKMKNRKRIIFIATILLFVVFNSIITPQRQNVLSKDRVEIAYTVEGKGEPSLVFVHGWSCDKSYWSNQVKAFSPKYKVVTIDLAGHGESGLERSDYTLQSFSEDVAAVVNKLGLKKIILIGHSMGGPVIIEAAIRLKGKVIGLVGADTFQNLGETFPEDQMQQFLKPFKENFVETTKGFVKTMFPPTADSILVKKVADDMSSAPPQIAVSAMENMFKDNAISALKELDAPIISINCDLYPVKVEENRKQVKSFEVKMMNGVGHFVMLEDPAKFNQLLQESIDELTK
jgi:pimeloyl-ACP methyl ester carboxylesterase